VALIACGGGGNNTSSTNLSDDMTGTITVAYSTTYVFDSDDTSVIWWDKVKKEFEAAYPKAHLNLQGFNGTDVDLVNKVALEYKSPPATSGSGSALTTSCQSTRLSTIRARPRSGSRSRR
jgi:ABC-type glycerol-3-phosphate transport system substrate-binding protein